MKSTGCNENVLHYYPLLHRDADNALEGGFLRIVLSLAFGAVGSVSREPRLVGLSGTESAKESASAYASVWAFA